MTMGKRDRSYPYRRLGATVEYELDFTRKAFQGTRTIVETKKEGKKGEETVSAPTVVFDGDKYRIKAGDKFERRVRSRLMRR